MAITADDVSLEDIIPITLDFAVVEGIFLSIFIHTVPCESIQASPSIELWPSSI